MRLENIAWITGLLEGEGSFRLSGRAIAILLNMTDKDVVERAASLLGGHVYALPVLKHYKPQWRAQLKGPNAAAWMLTMYPLFGKRRREQVTRALTEWRGMGYVRISPAVERSIVEAWNAGGVTKLGLARKFAVGRSTVYNVLQRSSDSFRESPRRRITPMEIAWLAGLIEGEGNIGVNGRSFTIRVKMTDHDVIVRAADLLGGKVYDATTPAKYKRQWLTQVKSSTAVSWAMTLYSWLGIRRRQQVRDGLLHWRLQGNGVIGGALGDVIRSRRAERTSQADIMTLLKVSKSTVYRHTRHRVPRMRVT